MRQRLSELGAARAQKSAALTSAVAERVANVGAKRVAIFSPLPSEPDLEGLWRRNASRFCYPRVLGKTLEFVDVSRLEDLSTSPWHPGIRESTDIAALVVAPGEIDVILVPGLAFTRDGARLGRGGGYYDRYLATMPASTLKIGVCFAVQIVASLPTEPHDQRVDTVATEEGFLA